MRHTFSQLLANLSARRDRDRGEGHALLRLLSVCVLAALIAVLSVAPASAAEPTESAEASAPADEPAPAPDEKPAEDPAPAPAEEPVAAPADDPAPAPADEPVSGDKPADDPAPAPADEPVSGDKPADDPAPAPADEPTPGAADDPAPAEPASPPSISSDKSDYAPGELVVLTGDNWQQGESVRIQVDDDKGRTWKRDVTVTAADDGTVKDQFNLPDWFIATYVVTATGSQSGTATTSFTDGNVKAESSGVAASQTWTLKVTLYTAQANCTGPSNSTDTVVLDGAKGDGKKFDTTVGVGATQSVRFEASPTTSGGGTFDRWSSGSPFTVLSSGVICLPGFQNGSRTYTANYVTAPAATSTSVGGITASASTFGGTTNLSATVSPAGAPGSLSFFVDGSATAASGTVSYDSATGVATLSNYSHGLNASTTPYSVRAVFTSSSSSYSGSEATNTSALTVNKASQSLAVEDPDAGTYGEKLSITTSGGSGDGAVTFSTTDASDACQIGTGTDADKVEITKGTGTCEIVATKAADGNYDQAVSPAHTVTVAKATQATLTVASPSSGTYGDKLLPTHSGGSGDGAVSFAAAGTACAMGTGPDAGKLLITSGTGDCTVTATKAADGNYNEATSEPLPVTISKANQATLTVTSPSSGTFGQKLDPAASGGSGDGALTFSAAGTACAMGTGTDTGKLVITSGTGDCTLTATKAADDNYNEATSEPFSVTVSKAAATLSFVAASLSQTYDESPKTVGVTTTPADLSTVNITYDGGSTAPTNAGSYAVAATLDNPNYQAEPISDTLLVNKAAGSVTISNIPTSAAFGGSFTPTYTQAGDGTASTKSNSPTICSVDNGGVVSFLAIGDCKLQAEVAEGTNHLAATGTEQTFSISTAPTTTAVSVTPSPQQYSDKVTFKATISPDAIYGTAPATGVTFKVGTQAMNASPVTLVPGTGPDAGKLVATLADVALLEPTPTPWASNGQMSPGAKTVTAEFTGVNPNFAVTNATTSLTINKEDATADFSAANFYSVPSGTAKVTLSATVSDAADGSRGDIRNAKVTFLVDGSAKCSNLPVGLVNGSESTVGSATCNVDLGFGTSGSTQYTIGISVNGYYQGYGADVVTVSQATSNMITGGGYLVLQKSSGLKAGAVGSKNNFGFNVKYSKGGTNPQGNMNIIVRNGDRVYQIKGNAIASLSVNATAKTATFNSKANIRDITDPLNPISVDGNASLQVVMTDKGEPGSTDTIGITVWNKSGGLWYSSNWGGTKTVEQLLGGGNLVVR